LHLGWVLVLVLGAERASGAIRINELVAAPSERQLAWSSNGIPRLGSGVAWTEPGFAENGWSAGPLPAGYGFSGLATDLSGAMRDKAPSLYVRKEFFLSAEQASITDPLSLWVDYNDGFVAYLNGREVARANCGITNRFIYASQSAFNVSTTTTLVEFRLGPANGLVVAGRNVLAIQAHNAEQPSTTSNPARISEHVPTPEFKLNAGLRSSGGIISTQRMVALDFNNATGARRVLANTNGAITLFTEGTPAPNGWLAQTPGPLTDAAWQALRLVLTEKAGGGANNGGGLELTSEQTGPNQAASVPAPLLNMTGAWTPGSVTAGQLAGTLFRFRCRSTAGAQWRLRFDPSPGESESALTGFPVVMGTNETPLTFVAAVGGMRVLTVNASGSQSLTQTGAVVSPALSAFASGDVRNMSFRLVEDATPGAGYDGSTGELKAEILQAAGAGTSWGFNYGGIPVQTWTPSNISTQELGYASFRFACRIPPGVTWQLWAEPGNGSVANRLDWGTLTGDGTWQIVQREFAGLPGAENFRNALNASGQRAFRMVFQTGAGLSAGTWLELDELQIVPWRKYEVRLAEASGGTAAFLSLLNAGQLTSFQPVFEKLSDASGGIQTLRLDDYEVFFYGTNVLTQTNFIANGAAGGDWKYWVGRAEPSGGIFDPGLLTNSFTSPAGEESDFDAPSAFVPWIELHNDGPLPVDLARWSLTDEREQTDKWRFPSNTVLSAGGYLVVLCDDREEANGPSGPATFLHANFSLNTDGEYVALYTPEGVWADGLTNGYPNQVFFCSYGRSSQEAAQLGFLATATPGQANAGTFYPARVDAPEFMRPDGTIALPGGIYRSNSLSLWLTNHTPGSIIRYTLDGSEPTEARGSVFLTALTLTQATDKTGIVVRARAFLPAAVSSSGQAWLPSGVKSHTYLLRQPPALTNVPALLFTGQKDRAFYRAQGLLAINGGTYQTASGGGEVWQANGPQSFNEVLLSGIGAEREVQMEYYFPPRFYPAGQEPLRIDVGLRVSSSPYQRARMKLTGAEVNSPWQPWYDATEKPSFNIYFVGDYGPSRLDYRLFPNYDVKEFQHLRVRAGKNDNGNPFLTDELVRRLWIEMGHVGAKGLFCSLYLDGVYKGVFNLTERVREPLFQNHYRSTADWDVRYVVDWVNGDPVAYNVMRQALNRDMAQLSNYVAATAYLDPDNFADYYLLNIYSAMWDWPENNYVLARERSTGPLGRFRFTVWDAEGGFNINGYYAKPVSFNTVTELATKNVDIANMWQRLSLSPEFRLRFADRVQQHCFHGGVLDDRDPDGTGPQLSVFQQQFNDLAFDVAPLVAYNHGQPLQTNLFATWTAPGTGRRSYLLGTTAGRQMLRDAGLWPVTEPPEFSQHGGTVPPGYSLSMTSVVAVAGQTASIYYTMDGRDPREMGGAFTAGAQLYAGPLTLSNVTTVKARARNDGNGEWSALTEATFAPSALAPSSNTLVLAEIMYHPPDASSGEIAAGWSDADDFEFLRLMNVSAVPLALANMRFTAGVTFDFEVSPLQYLNPGRSLLVVKNRGALAARYGALVATVAGEYSGNLANGGERLALMNGSETLFDFMYGDGGAWPESPDGDGPSLLLREPFNHPDPSQPTNWVASALPGGFPGGAPVPMSYDAWRALLWGPTALTNSAASDPASDADGDGLSNYAEYALGLHPRRNQPTKRPQAFLEESGGQRYLVIQFTASSAAIGASFGFEVSSNLLNWSSPALPLDLLWSQPNIEGTVLRRYREPLPLEPSAQHFLRLKVTAP
jgi:hypothetical protein